MLSKSGRPNASLRAFLPFVVLSAALAGELAGPMRVAAAQTADPIYRGKQLRMVIGNNAGGAYDTYARILALHLSRHIPGNPTIINQNMPVAASMQATNWAYDGTGGAVCYYNPLTGEQRSSLGVGGVFTPCPLGWEARESVKHRFIHTTKAYRRKSARALVAA